MDLDNMVTLGVAQPVTREYEHAPTAMWGANSALTQVEFHC